jgi:hypothetical protein
MGQVCSFRSSICQQQQQQHSNANDNNTTPLQQEQLVAIGISDYCDASSHFALLLFGGIFSFSLFPWRALDDECEHTKIELAVEKKEFRIA